MAGVTSTAPADPGGRLTPPLPCAAYRSSGGARQLFRAARVQAAPSSRGLTVYAAAAVQTQTLKIGTRGSPLALAQAYLTRDLLKVGQSGAWAGWTWRQGGSGGRQPPQGLRIGPPAGRSSGALLG